MAPRATLLLCVVLAVARFAQSQDLRTCYNDAESCTASLFSGQQKATTTSDKCRIGRNYAACLKKITSCGSDYHLTAITNMEPLRTQMIILGCADILAEIPDLPRCRNEVSDCNAVFKLANRAEKNPPELCRYMKEYFTCATGITSCGSSFQERVRVAVERERAKLRPENCEGPVTEDKDHQTCLDGQDACASKNPSQQKMTTVSDFCRSSRTFMECINGISSCGSGFYLMLITSLQNLKTQMTELGCSDALPEATDPLKCRSEVSGCIAILSLAEEAPKNSSEMCRDMEHYFTCATRITSCGGNFHERVQLAVEKERAELHKKGCGKPWRKENAGPSRRRGSVQHARPEPPVPTAWPLLTPLPPVGEASWTGSASAAISRPAAATQHSLTKGVLVIFRNEGRTRRRKNGAEGTAVVSVVTLLLFLVAALVWGQ